MDNIYKKIVNEWGHESQINMVTEEIGELLQALSKFRRSQNKTDEVKIKAYEHLCEEIADVENMIHQLREIFDSNLIDQYRKSKLERISKKLFNNEIGVDVCTCLGEGCEKCNGEGYFEKK